MDRPAQDRRAAMAADHSAKLREIIARAVSPFVPQPSAPAAPAASSAASVTIPPRTIPDGLPAPGARWSPARKLAVLDALDAGALTVCEADRLYALSVAEIEAWRRDVARGGVRALGVCGSQANRKLQRPLETYFRRKPRRARAATAHT